MANATDIVKKGAVRWTDEFAKRSSATLASATIFYPHAGLGVTTGGYLAKFDDAQSLILAGIVAQDQGDVSLPAGTAGDGTIDIPYQKPRYIELAIASVAVTDIGKTVYATDDNTGTLATTTTYGNVWGVVVDVVASGIALVELAYDGVAANLRLHAARHMAATGAQTITRWDVGKKIFVPNTATLTLTLPAVADVQSGATLAFFKNHATDTNAITLDANASENIDGAATLATLDAAWDTAVLVSDGTRWIVESRDIA